MPTAPIFNFKIYLEAFSDILLDIWKEKNIYNLETCTKLFNEMVSSLFNHPF